MKHLNAATRAKAEAKELIYVLIDYSPSMESGDYQPSRKLGAIEANRRLIEAKAALFGDDRIGIIAFSGDARCLHRPVAAGTHREELYQSLGRDISVSGGTDFSVAMELAEESLFGNRPDITSPGWLGRIVGGLFESSGSGTPANRSPKAEDDITRRIIMLTDGEHNGDGDPVQVAHRLKKAGVIIECIGIAGSPNEVDEVMLKRIASRDEAGKPRYCFIGDTSSLIRKYKSMANQIRPV